MIKQLLNYKYIVFLFTFILFASFQVEAKNKTHNSPVKIQADEMRYFGNEKKSTFHGNVVAVSDNYSIRSRKNKMCW